ncbi:MAG: hypothetical protein R2818_07465 [Flavobacteriales bacterium]
MNIRRALVLVVSLVVLIGWVIMFSPFGSDAGDSSSEAGNMAWAPLTIPPEEQVTVPTSDPPPFDRACLFRSGHTTAVGDFRPNLHFDMESSADGSLLSARHAHSGNTAYRIVRGQEYTPAIERNVSTIPATLAKVAVGLWVYSDTTIGKFTIVADAHRGEEQLTWMGKDLDPVGSGAGNWMRFQAEFDLRDLHLSGDDRVRIYFWNADKQELFIDDMDVVFRIDGVSGKPSGTPFDTEARTIGVAPPPFARFAMIAPVDPHEHGVVPGQLAPSNTSDPFPVAKGYSGRLRYVPGNATGELVSTGGRTEYLVRAWCPELGKDLFGFERVLISPGVNGLRIIGFDVDIDPSNGQALVAKDPRPMGAECSITPPSP